MSNENAIAQPDAGVAEGTYIYALGQVLARFPRLSIEKEFAQVASRSTTRGQTDREILHAVLSLKENRYIARQMCWLLAVQNLDAYVLQPRDPADFELLVNSLRPAPSPLDMDVVIGRRGPIAPRDWCNGLTVPVVFFDQIYSFDRETMVRTIPRPPDSDEQRFSAVANELLDRVMLLADNVGASDDHRALNYLAMRYPGMYLAVADAHQRNASLTGVDVRDSRLTGTRKIVEVILTFTSRSNEFTEKFFARVDVTEEFPFLVTRLSPYFDH